MIRDLRHLFVVVCDNYVVTYATNFSAFYREVRSLGALDEHVRSESTLQRHFKKEKRKIILGNDKRVYVLQKVK